MRFWKNPDYYRKQTLMLFLGVVFYFVYFYLNIFDISSSVSNMSLDLGTYRDGFKYGESTIAPQFYGSVLYYMTLLIILFSLIISSFVTKRELQKKLIMVLILTNLGQFGTHFYCKNDLQTLIPVITKDGETKVIKDKNDEIVGTETKRIEIKPTVDLNKSVYILLLTPIFSYLAFFFVNKDLKLLKKSDRLWD